MASVIKYLMYKCFLYVSLPQGIIFKMGCTAPQRDMEGES